MNQPNISAVGQDFLHTVWRITKALDFNLKKGFPVDEGRDSPYVFTPGALNTADALSALAVGIAAKLHPFVESFDLLFGPGFLVGAVATQVAAYYPGVRFVAKEELNKAGIERRHVAIVAMTVAECGDAIRQIDEAGGTVFCCIVPFDREERIGNSSVSTLQEFTARYEEIPIHAVAGLNDLIEVARDRAAEVGDAWSEELLECLLDYQAEHGCNATPIEA